MFKAILLGIVAAIIGFAAYIGSQPPQYSVSRSLLIGASPATVFDQVNELKKWEAWSPWRKLDPNAKMTYEGPSAGKDAVSAWNGNDKVGEGKMTIVESKPAELVRMRLDFVRPFPGTSNAELSFKPEGGKTRVTWTMSGEQGFIERAMCTLMRLNMDTMIGADFEAGLANLKEHVNG